MTKYRYSWCGYAPAVLMLYLIKDALRTQSYSFPWDYVYDGTTILVGFIVFLNLYFTTLSIDSEGITQKNLFRSKILFWDEIESIEKTKHRVFGTTGFKMTGYSKKIKVSFTLKNFKVLINDIASYKKDLFSDLPITNLAEEYYFQNKALQIIYILIVTLLIFSIFE